MTPAHRFALLLPLVFAGAGVAGAQPAPVQSAPAQSAPAQPVPPAATGPATAPPAPAAQPMSATSTPPGPFALDVRVAMPSFNTGSTLADPLDLRTDQLPSRGLGLLFGAHVYPLRGKRMSLGLGADIVRTSGSKAPDPEDDTAATDPTIETKFSAFVPQVSLNFGTSRGWSYIGGGYAWTRRSTGDVDAEVAEGTRLMGLHYGGGARWFISPHVAFSFDLRFYRIPEQAAEGTTTTTGGTIAAVPFQPKSRLFLMSAGLSFK